MVSDKVRTLIYLLSAGLILFALLYWILKTIGVVHSFVESLISIFAGLGIFTFMLNIKGELGEVKGRLDSLEDNIENTIESKFTKFSRRFTKEMTGVKVSIARLEGRLDEISKKLK